VTDRDWYHDAHLQAPPTTASPLDQFHGVPTQQLPGAGFGDPNQFANYPAPYPAQPPAPQYAGYPQPRPTNGMAIASLVASLLVAPLGIVFGHISLSQIKRSGEDGKGLAIAGLVIGYLATVGAVIAVIFVVGVMAVVGSTVHRINSQYPSHRYSAPTTSASPIGVPDATAVAINTAQVGDCIRRVTGARRSDGSLDVTVSSAVCGSSTATDRVTMRTTSTSRCASGEWVETKAYSPPIVLCLTKLR
jgi:Domain of unknown function (DUF4190)